MSTFYKVLSTEYEIRGKVFREVVGYYRGAYEVHDLKVFCGEHEVTHLFSKAELKQFELELIQNEEELRNGA